MIHTSYSVRNHTLYAQDLIEFTISGQIKIMKVIRLYIRS